MPAGVLAIAVTRSRSPGASFRQVLQSPALPVVMLVLAVCAWLAFDRNLFNDGDTSWHLAAGQWILDHGSVPNADPFSSTFRGASWTAHEWFAEAIMAGVQGWLGWAGLALFSSLCLAATFAIVGHGLIRSIPPRYAVATLALLLLILAPFVLARPHLVAWPILAGWMIALLDARARNQAPRLYWSLLMLAWANLHASYIFGLALVGLFALEALLVEPDRRKVLMGWGSFGTASLLLACLTPHGPEGLLFPLQVSRMEALPLIQEWRPTRLPGDWKFAAFAAAVLGVGLWRWRQLKVLRLVLLFGLAWLAFTHARHQAVFAIVTPLLLAYALAPQGLGDRKASFDKPVLVVLAVGLIAIAIARLALPMNKGDSATDPATAISSLPAELRSQPVFNTYAFGGPLIRNGIAPFIDGRADMYGDEFIFMHQAIVDGDAFAFERVCRRWGIRWTILAPQSGLVRRLDHDSRWRRLYADQWAVVHVRR